MEHNTFNPKEQEFDLSSKIVVGLERVSGVFKILLWEKAKRVGLSPIQIQLLIFIAFHKQELCNVSHLAKEFNVTKPTISDAIKVLEHKGIVEKDFSSADSRSFSIFLSPSGKELVSEVSDFANPLKTHLKGFSQDTLESLFGTLSELIYKLNQSGILTIQRTCYGCSFYDKNEDSDFCNLLGKALLPQDIRIDCPEFVESK
ncbi:MarR family winged helix-turn-helix transcriptional regulator [Aureisphaera sp. CAU 1614]|uniref:MarR family winged helix-turn-helix transcriptional regulator n=1 Tax=Halomarinibacterium sedimenti TaxID=2857106 RepID=A0A9X1FPS9_9FLAO|nr:MarR family winged helix-turn-helix transcriptional regulator [Halomarinibacterium sedimenti]MBW2937617.1 MarR family winged helix-turn-helix transcriptional regulator [Halomarinibacterium sedimenti]